MEGVQLVVIAMNTKQSVIIGWTAYTAAFAVGGGIGIYKYRYGPGGRMDREKEADKIREEEAKLEAEEEHRIRQKRLTAKNLSTKETRLDRSDHAR